MSKSGILRAFSVFTASALLFGCSDSSGPGTVDSEGALQSLALGLSQTGGIGSPTTTDANATFGALAPVLDQVNVTIDGTSQGMYAVGITETYPPGTCEETLFEPPISPPDPGVCTPPPLVVGIILWQTHSATQPPDRILMLIGEPGTSNFDFTVTTDDFPGAAIYYDGPNQIWESESGTLTSEVTATSQTCSIPLPPYAKSAICNIATFSESGSVVLTHFEQSTTIPGPHPTVTIGIPSITLHGIWLAITEIQPLPLVANATPSRLLPQVPTLLRVAPGTSRISIQR